MSMHTLHLISLLFSLAVVLPLDDDHVTIHEADIHALETHAAHVDIEPLESSPIDRRGTPQRRISRIFIPENWQGGDEALIHIERIFADAPDPKPIVYILGTPEISVDCLKKLEHALPKGTFARRASIVFGILHQPHHERGVRVSQVLKDSSAALAGIIPDDVITQIDETNIVDFDSLTESLARKKPGHSATVRVVRNGESRKLVVKLSGWYVEKDKNQPTKR